MLDALGDPTRRRIFERLAAGPRSVAEIHQGLPISRPAVSQHLRVLKDAGLVTDRKDGTRRYYLVRRDLERQEFTPAGRGPLVVSVMACLCGVVVFVLLLA